KAAPIEIGFNARYIMDILPLAQLPEAFLTQAAALLVAELPHGWPTLDDALEEVREALEPSRTAFAAVEGPTLVGWIGSIPSYDDHVWEMHPLAVCRDRQRRGVGRALVEYLEAAAREAGVLTIMLGTDDQHGQTSLAGQDLYPDPLAAVAAITNPGGHSYEFYLRCGYVLVGVVPDANGFGQPDILMAKRILAG
ncbi:MAG: GNAT family N-acetyltransferase, partial [bacterium]